MKKLAALPILLACFAGILLWRGEPRRAEAVPSSGDAIKQLGGPIAKDCPLTADEIVEKYNKETTYEALFYPFGDKDPMVFPGTARSVVHLTKASAETALQEARKISGYTKEELLKCRELAGKFEANAKQYTTQDFLDILKEAFGMMGSTTGASTDFDKIAAALSYATDGSLGLKKLAGEEVDTLDLLLAGADALAATATLFNEKVFPIINTAGKGAGPVVFIISSTYTTARKYAEHQRLWKQYVDYVVARRKLHEYRELLNITLAPLLKEYEGLDIEFDSELEISREAYSPQSIVKTTATFKARFARNCTLGENPMYGTPNDDGFVSKYELTFKADMKGLSNMWAKDAGRNPVVERKPYFTAISTVVKKDRSKAVEPFYAEATKSDYWLPMSIVSGKEGEGKLIFEGSLADDGSFIYNQGGKYEQELEGWTEQDGEVVIIRTVTSSLILDKKGLRAPYKETYWNKETGTRTDEGVVFEDEGDFFGLENAFKLSKARMVVDFTKKVE